jgi:hypothetical protein
VLRVPEIAPGPWSIEVEGAAPARVELVPDEERAITITTAP